MSSVSFGSLGSESNENPRLYDEQGRINLNIATRLEIETFFENLKRQRKISGIGPAKYNGIIAFRMKEGKFSDLNHFLELFMPKWV